MHISRREMRAGRDRRKPMTGLRLGRVAGFWGSSLFGRLNYPARNDRILGIQTGALPVYRAALVRNPDSDGLSKPRGGPRPPGRRPTGVNSPAWPGGRLGPQCTS